MSAHDHPTQARIPGPRPGPAIDRRLTALHIGPAFAGVLQDRLRSANWRRFFTGGSALSTSLASPPSGCPSAEPSSRFLRKPAGQAGPQFHPTAPDRAANPCRDPMHREMPVTGTTAASRAGQTEAEQRGQNPMHREAAASSPDTAPGTGVIPVHMRPSAGICIEPRLAARRDPAGISPSACTAPGKQESQNADANRRTPIDPDAARRPGRRQHLMHLEKEAATGAKAEDPGRASRVLDPACVATEAPAVPPASPFLCQDPMHREPTALRSGPLRNGNPRGNPNTAPRCGAKTRSGCPCRAPAMRGKLRCRMHGGASTGPRTAEGLERLRAARTTHGRYTGAARARQRYTLTCLRRARVALEAMRLQPRLPPMAQARLRCCPPELFELPPALPCERIAPTRAQDRAIACTEQRALAPWRFAIEYAKGARYMADVWAGFGQELDRYFASMPPVQARAGGTEAHAS